MRRVVPSLIVAATLAGCPDYRNFDFCAAAMDGDLGELQRLLDDGAGIDGPCKGGSHDLGGTPLIKAAASEQGAAVKWLLAHGAATTGVDGIGYSALMHAVSHDDVEMVRALLAAHADVSGAEGARLLDVAGNHRLNVASNKQLHAAVDGAFGDDVLGTVGTESDATQIIHALLDAGAPAGLPVSDGGTPLHWAAASGDAPLIQALAARGAEVDASDKDGRTPLMIASRNDRLEAVKALLALGAKPGRRSKDGRTALLDAASLEIDDALRRAGAQGDNRWYAPDRVPDLFAQAVDHGDLFAIRYLLARGMDPNGRFPDKPAIWWALHRGHVDIFEALMAAGAKVDAPYDGGWTLLSSAVTAGELDKVKLLLAHGADPRLAGRDGETPLEIASRGPRAEIKALIEAALAATPEERAPEAPAPSPEPPAGE
ncbi:MAG: hypothetical protein EP329_07640 [Deltaproteobacteria bacterium]|nr:MAG: hypothetical protein EP329_07640 [Deltaproteobacteria bacterium]